MAIKIITDSTAYLNEEFIKQYDIKVLSLIVNFENESFREIEISNGKRRYTYIFATKHFWNV